MVPNRELGGGTQLSTLGEVIGYLGNSNAHLNIDYLLVRKKCAEFLWIIQRFNEKIYIFKTI